MTGRQNIIPNIREIKLETTGVKVVHHAAEADLKALDNADTRSVMDTLHSVPQRTGLYGSKIVPCPV
jgi:hypothetical protein